MRKRLCRHCRSEGGAVAPICFVALVSSGVSRGPVPENGIKLHKAWHEVSPSKSPTNARLWRLFTDRSEQNRRVQKGVKTQGLEFRAMARGLALLLPFGLAAVAPWLRAPRSLEEARGFRPLGGSERLTVA